jgi:uncharacterized protein
MIIMPFRFSPAIAAAHRLGRLLAPHRYQLRGNIVSDAHLAALAVEHGLEVCSNDSAFARFSEVRWTNPVAPGQPLDGERVT